MNVALIPGAIPIAVVRRTPSQDAELDYLTDVDALGERADDYRAAGNPPLADDACHRAFRGYLAAIAEHDNPTPPERPCGICGGIRVCDIGFHLEWLP